jgi:hypothetical protein
LLLPQQKIGRPAAKAIAGEREDYCDFGRCRGRILRRMLSANTAFVMPGLVPGIHVFKRIMARKTWMAGTSPAMTAVDQS